MLRTAPIQFADNHVSFLARGCGFAAFAASRAEARPRIWRELCELCWISALARKQRAAVTGFTPVTALLFLPEDHPAMVPVGPGDAAGDGAFAGAQQDLLARLGKPGPLQSRADQA